MAEFFNNYVTSKTRAKGDTFTIVPVAGASIPSTDGAGVRKNNSIVQLHSIYITQTVNQNYAVYPENPISQAVFVSLIIYDRTSNKSIYLGNSVLVLPHSAFYIEKTITLLAQQELRIQIADFNTLTNKEISTVCSGVEIY